MNYEIKNKTIIIVVGGLAYAVGLALFFMSQL